MLETGRRELDDTGVVDTLTLSGAQIPVVDVRAWAVILAPAGTRL